MSTPGTQPQAAGWYPDPAGSGGQRWHDGQGWTGQVMHGKPAQALGRGFARLADWLGRGLAVCGGFYGLLALPFIYLWLSPPDLAVAPDGTMASGQSSADPFFGVLGLAYLGFSLVMLATQVTWLVWQYQLASSAPAKLRRTPGMHVVWWFVPVANLVVPRSNIGDLWHAYSARRTGSPSEPTPALFSVWWALWLSPYLVMPLLVLALTRATTLDGAVAGLFGMFALMLLGQAAAGFAARSVVRDLSWRALLYWAEAA